MQIYKQNVVKMSATLIFQARRNEHLLQIPFLSHESKHKYDPTSDFNISLFPL